MPSETDAQGRAKRGSQMLMQLYANAPARREAAEAGIFTALPTLLGAGATQVGWLSPVATPHDPATTAKPYAEYRDSALLELLGREDLAAKLSEYWPRRGPVWDGVLAACDEDGKTVGPILVEAKAHPAEFRDTSDQPGSRGQPASRKRIHARLKETRTWLGVAEDPAVVAMWEGELYQSANRYAALRFWRQVAGERAWLLNVYFLDDGSHRPTRLGEWLPALAAAECDLGLNGVHVPDAGRLFLPAGSYEELVAATSCQEVEPANS